MSNDRDVRKPIVPPPAVRAQTAAPINEPFDEEDLTPVEGTPLRQLTKRAESAAASSKGAFAAIRKLEDEFRKSVDRDIKDHQSMREAIDACRDDVGELSKVMGDVRENVGKMSGQLETLVGLVEEERKVARLQITTAIEVDKHQKIAAIDIEKTSEVAKVDDEKDEKKHRRERITKLVTSIAALITAAATGGALLKMCG